jgi:hypothetical protein
VQERYIDPEPLIALWPLWIPDEHKHLTTDVPPGLPVREHDRPKPPRVDAGEIDTDTN